MEWLESCAQKTEEGKDFLTAFWESVGSSSLGEEEKEALRVLGEGFGVGDLEAQISDLALCRARVAVILKKAMLFWTVKKFCLITAKICAAHIVPLTVVTDAT
jgi:hypothetical protein